jgi:hypothetical protein
MITALFHIDGFPIELGRLKTKILEVGLRSTKRTEVSTLPFSVYSQNSYQFSYYF